MAVNEFQEVTLTVDAIQDYKVCELFYEYKYNQKQYEHILARELNAQRFENTLKRIASFFFYKKQDGAVPSYNALLNRWEKLWYPKDMDAYDLTIEQHEIVHGNMSSYTTAATAALLQFHDDFANDPATPLMIDEKFLVPLDTNIRLKGSIDLVLRYRDIYKVIKWSGRQRRPNANKLGLDFAAQKIAFDYRNDTKKHVTYSLYDLGTTRPGHIAMHPNATDVDALTFWAKDIVTSDVFVPRRGYTAYCKGCPFDEPCSKFEFPKESK